MLRRSLLVLAFVATSLATGLLPAAHADPDCAVTEKLVNPCRPWLGAAAGNYPSYPATRQGQIGGHETRIGRQLDVVHLYHAAGLPPLDPDDLFYANRPGTIVSLTWKPAENWASAGGSNATVNATIDATADSIKSLGSTKIMLTLHHEPENDVSGGATGCTTYSGSSGTPAAYRAMWRNVEQRFAARGATNVVWVMNYMGMSQFDCMVDDLWPGDDLVDWVVWDPYSESTSWSQTVGRFYNLLTASSDLTHGYLSKPWGLGEWGVWHKATQAFTYQFYEQARVSISTGEFPRLRLYSIFDNKGDSPTPRIGYNSKGVFDQVEIDRYRVLANDPVFRGTGTGGPPVDVQAPSAPADLEPADITDHSVELQWAPATDNVGVVSYRIYRDGTLIDTSADTTFADSTVQPTTTYRYQVQAVDSAGNVGRASGELVVAVPVALDTEAPSAPSSLTATENTSQRVTLHWQAATDNVGVASYIVWRDGAQFGGPVTGTTVQDTSVEPETHYTYRVQAVDAAGNVGEWTADLDVVTPPPPDTEAPGPPTDLTVTETTAQRVTLEWQPATDNIGVVSYQVVRNGVVVVGGEAVGDATFTDTSVHQAAAYTYRVHAVDAAGNVGAATNEVAVETPAVPDDEAPGKPTSLRTTENTSTRVTLAWDEATDNIGVASYTVFRDGVVWGDPVTGTTVQDASVGPETSYTYWVQAVDAAGNVGATSDELDVVTPPPPDTQAPTTPTNLRTTANTSTQITLAWNAATDNIGVVSYRLFRNSVAIGGVITGTTYSDSTVVASTSYTYRVQAVDAAGNLGPLTANLTVVTPAPPDTQAPTTPTNLRTTANTSTRVTLAWNAAADNVGVVSYRLFRNSVAIGGVIIGTSYADNAVAASTSYTYRVQAVDAAGNMGALTANLAVSTPAPPDTQAPSRPTNLTGTPGAGRATLRWNASTDNVKVQGYYVYQGTTRIGTVTALTYVVTGLKSKTTFTFSVRAFDAAGNMSAASTSVSVRTT